MKIFHCADLHLDAPADSRLDLVKAQIRRDELLLTFQHFLDTAAEENADAVLLCGDLFDRDHVSATAAAVVRDALAAHPSLPVYYLRGNHDRGNALAEAAGTSLPGLHVFGPSWTSYTLEGGPVPVVITGAEISPPPAGGTAALLSSLTLSPEAVNIVMLHGQLTAGSGASGPGPEEIPQALLQGRNIDLLALGHIHIPGQGRLDSRGTYICAGCMEGRGFDECGPRGYWVHTLFEGGAAGEGLLRSEFRPCARRTFYDLAVSADGCASSYDLAQRVRDVLAESDLSTDDLLRLRLVGEYPAEAEKSLPYLLHSFEGLFFYLEILDQTTDAVDYEEYRYDPGFPGAFVRTVQAREDLTDREKGQVIRAGLAALRGDKEVLL